MKPEFSRLVSVADMAHGPRTFELNAESDERKALARRFGLQSIDRLEAKVRLRLRAGGRRVSLKADFQADVVQSCVLTLQPVEHHIEAAIKVHFAPSDEIDSPRIVDIDLDAEDPPEALIDGKIDMGEVVAEHLALELDPFPHADGAAFGGMESGDIMEDGEVLSKGSLVRLGELRSTTK